MSLALLIAVVVSLAVPALVGYWRDPRRGVLALAGTMLGATVAGFWAARWGADLAAATGGDERALGLFAGYAALAMGALLVGYGAGELLPPRAARPALPQRLLGTLLGLLNGVLIAGYALRYAAATDPGFEEEMRGVLLARYVHDGLPLLFLGLGATLAAIILARRAVDIVRRATARPRQALPQQPPPPAAPGAPPANKEVQRKS